MSDVWKPSCDLKQMRERAHLLKNIRSFFEQRSVLEVETPLLCSATGTDPQLDFFSSDYHCAPNDKTMYLQTSPEFAMKRLLAAGSGSIFQICKAFRNGEAGRFHNPEFSILEWYRVDYSIDQLMDEVVELISGLVEELAEDVYKVSYVELFQQQTGLNPLLFNRLQYAEYAQQNGIKDAVSICEDDHSMWLDFIFSYKVQPALESTGIAMVYAYPAIQSSLARINSQNSAVADRFEVFLKGIEVANGFYELSDATEQAQRFDQENQCRQQKGLAVVEKDEKFLQALRAGLPDCSGVALGLDRLLMVRTAAQTLNDVIAFPFERA